MSLCEHFVDPAEACQCREGVRYASLAGGGVHYQILRLPCIPLSNRRGETASRCEKYTPEPGPNNNHRASPAGA